MANSERVIIDVDADAAADVPPSRIVRGNGDAAAPFEVASSDSEDDNPPTKLAPEAGAGVARASRQRLPSGRRRAAPCGEAARLAHVRGELLERHLSIMQPRAAA